MPLGNPKYCLGQKVKFFLKDIKDMNGNVMCAGGWYTGSVEIIDRYGTFFNDKECCYDIMSEIDGEPTLFKHLTEKDIEDY